MSFFLYIIAGALATTRPEAAATILGAAGTYVVEPPRSAQLISLIVTQPWAMSAHRISAHARGDGLDQALACTLAQATQALSELQSGTQP
jgi:hypothetical protein